MLLTTDTPRTWNDEHLCATSSYCTSTLIRRFAVMLALLAAFAQGARAESYVIFNGTYYLAINNNNNGATAVATFNPATCVWTGPAEGDSGYLSITRNGRTYYLNRGNWGLSVSSSTNNRTTWWPDGDVVYTKVQGWGGTSNYYLRYSTNSYSPGWDTSTSSANVLYICSTEAVEAISGERAYTVSLEEVVAEPAVLDVNESATVTANGGSVTITVTTTPAHTKYTLTPGGGGTEVVYYSLDGSSVTATSPSSITTETATPTGYNWALSSMENTSLASAVTTNNGNTVTYNKSSATDMTVNVNVTAFYTVGDEDFSSEERTVTITLNRLRENPTDVTAQDLTLTVGEIKPVDYALIPVGAYDDVEFGIANTSIATVVQETGMVTGVRAGVTIATVTAYRSDGTTSAALTATSTVTVLPQAPTIEIESDGGDVLVTLATPETQGVIYYTTDGVTPTTGSMQYGGAPVTVPAGTTVKAIVVVTVNGQQLTSAEAEVLCRVESGVEGTAVYLYDLEDHNWTYYSGVDVTLDGGSYNTNYVGKIYSPNPRNVKITYNGVNGILGSTTAVRVSIVEGENQNSFVYYKTLEQGSTEGEYPYTVISNPFSVRPSTGSGSNKVYYGFAGWKIVSGGEYIKGYDNNDVLPLDAEIAFEELPYQRINCTSAEIVFETTWTQANVQTGNNIATMLSRFSGGTYETNFAVLTGTYTSAWTGNKHATITSVYPDGSTDARNNVYTRLNLLTLNAGYTIKYEHIHLNNSNSTFSMGSGTKTLYLGRGITNTTANGICCNLIQGYNNSISSGGLTYTLKIESGIYNYVSFAKGYENAGTTNTVTGTVAIKSILGCDYDRAAGNNSNLKILKYPIFGYAENNAQLLRSPSAGDKVLDVTFKSGNLNSELTSAGTADVPESFYIGIGGGYSPGYRVFTMEGGEMWSLAAGICENTAETNSIRFRIKGGLIKGSIYGSAANANSFGYKQMVITGGHIKGWIAGGGNGTSANGGVTTGSTYLYVGGNCRVDSEGSTTKINSSLGGQVFGSGSGVENTTDWGQLLYGSNVVVADNAYVERSVFGGGNFGWTEQYATIYITGDRSSVGSVYGGANQNEGDFVKLYMNGGTVREGIYGGSNTTGTVSDDVTMQINGGTVGSEESPANIHGGGYGSATVVSGNVDITLGRAGQTEKGVVVYGDVYGGSALGKVNGTAATNTYHTNVTLNKGVINGSLYGGALGSGTVAANVYGPVAVRVYGGSVRKTAAEGSGGVYGANNINGAPQRSVTVDVYGTDPAPTKGQYALHAVYGGGNRAPYTYGNGFPKVTVHNCGNSIEYVYGGGNAAAVTSTDVTIWGGNVIGNVFGGGNGTVSAANVTGDTHTKIYGGTILNVYGGSNTSGTIGGDINVLVDSQSENGDTPCTIHIGSVYGGGNQAASNVGNVVVECTGEEGRIDNVYGGANQADITGDIDLHINGGNIGNVFGGNNKSGNIKGTITVTVGDEPNDCGIFTIDNVYGGGNLAPYAHGGNFPSVNLVSGLVRYAIYGGGLGETAVVTGNPQVNMTGGTVGHTERVNDKDVVRGGDVFGGGNAAAVEGNINVHIVGGEVKRNVYGGGNQAKVTGKTNVVIGQ